MIYLIPACSYSKFYEKTKLVDKKLFHFFLVENSCIISSEMSQFIVVFFHADTRKMCNEK